jgi:hypothetical protein
VTLTGVTLLIGIALTVAGVIDAIVSGVGGVAIAAVVVGVLLLGTHWGWVHVAEATGEALEHRRNSDLLGRRQLWLEQIKPYTRYDVTTTVDDDGSIRIVRARYEPVATERGFIFSRQVEREEVHSADERGAAVTERAELLRREAAADMERERQLYEVAADAYETALLDRDDEQERRAARRAASEALSEQINANLREPPLTE